MTNCEQHQHFNVPKAGLCYIRTKIKQAHILSLYLSSSICSVSASKTNWTLHLGLFGLLVHLPMLSEYACLVGSE